MNDHSRWALGTKVFVLVVLAGLCAAHIYIAITAYPR
jgi:hypothetical protein